MSAIGYIQVHAYTSTAQIPLSDVAIAITDTSGNGIALRLTNRSGKLDTPVEIPVPNRNAGQSPDTGQTPFAAVDLYARLENFEEIHIENLQVFPDVITEQPLALIPLSEFPDDWNKAEIFDTPPQNL